MHDLMKAIAAFRTRGLAAPAYIAAALLRRIKVKRTMHAIANAADNRTVFSLIYRNQWWDAGGESVSGPGSTMAFTETFRSRFEELLADKRITILFDAPCGDWNWMRHVRFPENMRYIGGDIVPDLVSRLREQFDGPQRSFRIFDITTDEFPKADLWLCRDCLAHLSFRDIRRALANFCRSQIRYAAISSYIIDGANSDIASGGFRELDLTRAPFHFPPPEFAINDWPDSENIRKVGLWRREQIADVLARAGSPAG